MPERPDYHRAARYPDDTTSKGPYDETQQLLHDTPCNLSVYRLRLGEDFKYHVVVLGNPPPEELHRRIEDILSTGEQVTLAPGVIEFLIIRRRQQSAEGPWVEKHHYPRRRRTR